jgi:ketosteroid isomerase-like protein
MKKSILTSFTLIILLIVSCETKNRDSLNEQDKERIKSEIRIVFEQMIHNSEVGNFEEAIQPFADIPDFISISSGDISDYDKFYKSNKAFFEILDHQLFNETAAMYTFIDKETLIVTYGATATAYLKDSQQFKADPLAITWIFKKMDDSWKVIYSHESLRITPINNDTTKTK